jgi:hypothetical protein
MIHLKKVMHVEDDMSTTSQNKNIIIDLISLLELCTSTLTSNIISKAISDLSHIDANLFYYDEKDLQIIRDGDVSLAEKYTRTISQCLKSLIHNNSADTYYNSKVDLTIQFFFYVLQFQSVISKDDTFQIEFAQNYIDIIAEMLRIPSTFIRINIFNSRANFDCNYLEFMVIEKVDDDVLQKISNINTINNEENDINNFLFSFKSKDKPTDCYVCSLQNDEI